MRALPLIAIADACGVAVEWLAAGRGPMRPTDPPPAVTPPPATIAAPPDASRSVFGLIDFNRLVAACGHALAAYHKRGTTPDAEQFARTLLAVYDHLAAMPEEQDPAALAWVLTAPWVSAHRRELEQRRAALQEFKDD